MTFGYDSKLAFSRSKAGIDSFARDLLNRLRMVRKSTEVRPYLPNGVEICTNESSHTIDLSYSLLTVWEASL